MSSLQWKGSPRVYCSHNINLHLASWSNSSTHSFVAFSYLDSKTIFLPLSPTSHFVCLNHDFWLSFAKFRRVKNSTMVTQTQFLTGVLPSKLGTTLSLIFSRLSPYEEDLLAPEFVDEQWCLSVVAASAYKILWLAPGIRHYVGRVCKHRKRRPGDPMW